MKGPKRQVDTGANRTLGATRDLMSSVMDWAKRGRPTLRTVEWVAALNRFQPRNTVAESLTGELVQLGPPRRVKARTSLERRAQVAARCFAQRRPTDAVREKAFAFLEAADLPTDADSIRQGGQTFWADGLATMQLGFAYRILHLATLLDGPDRLATAFEMGALNAEWKMAAKHGGTLADRVRFNQSKGKGGRVSGAKRRGSSDGPKLKRLVADEEAKKKSPFRTRRDAARWLSRDHPQQTKGRSIGALEKLLSRAS